VKRFCCRDVIPGCDREFTGVDVESVLDQVIAHAAADHGLTRPPAALSELVAATTHSVPGGRPRGHLRLIDGQNDVPDAATEPQMEHPAAGGHHEHSAGAAVLAFPRPRLPLDADDCSTSIRPGQTLDNQVAWSAAHHLDDLRTHAPIADLHADTLRAATRPHDTYRHECFFYRGTDDFVATLLPFVLGGLALGQPVMVAVAEPRGSALRAALGSDADAVHFVDMATLGANPARIIPAWLAFADSAGGRPMRGVGEPIWAGRRPAEITEAQFHEALLNLCPDAGTPLWLVCPYDVDALDPCVIEQARETHPFHPAAPDGISDLDAPGASEMLALGQFSAPLPDPVGPTTELHGKSGGVASQLLRHAAEAGLTDLASARLAAAADAVTNGTTELVGVRVWQDHAALVCQIDDAVGTSDPLVGRSATLPAQGRERGIRLANELCDLVQVRSGGFGTSVRLHSWL
jgi:predicted small metal-binding protein